jgi:MFS family permease
MRNPRLAARALSTFTVCQQVRQKGGYAIEHAVQIYAQAPVPIRRCKIFSRAHHADTSVTVNHIRHFVYSRITKQAGGRAVNPRSFWRYENGLIAMLMVTFGIVAMDKTSYGYIAPFVIKDLGLSNTQHGIIISCLSFTYALSSIALGLFSDATGKRKSLLILSVLVFSFCSVFSGMAIGFATMVAARMVMGLAEGGVLPIAQSLVALESSEKRLGINMGITQNFGGNLVGTFAAPLVLVAVAEIWGWRSAFYFAALPGFIMAVLIWRFVREPRAAAPGGERAPGVAPAPGATPAQMTTAESTPAKAGFGAAIADIYQHRNIWLCTALCIFMIAWIVLGSAFLPVFFTNARGISPTTMSILMSLLGAMATVCAFLIPGLSDRIGRKPVVILFSLLGAVTPLAALYLSDNVVLLGVLIAVGWMASGTTPIFMAIIPAETLPVRYLATSIGIILGVGELTGGVLSPVLAGWSADRFGLDSVMWLMAACSVISAAIALLIVETAPVALRKRAQNGASA